MEFTWKIEALKVLQTPEPNTVILSNFTVRGVEGELTASANHAVMLKPADPNNFLPYEQLTHDQAIAWTKEALEPEGVLSIEQEVQNQIDQQKQPVATKVDLPWS
jgi:hypothetical protein